MTSESAAPSLLGRLLTLAWPVVVARATQSVSGLADALMVAPLGESALAATTTGAMNTLAVVILPMGTAFIIQSFASQLHGAGDAAGARRYAYYGLLLAVLFAITSLILLPAVGPAIGLLGLAPEVRTTMQAYVTLRLLSVGPVVATEALGAYFGGIGNTRVSMQCGLVAMVSNIVLNWLLIQPRFGLPGYGVEGAALASTIASFLGLVPALLPLLRGGPRPRLLFGEFRRMLAFGLPNGINWFLEFGAFVFFINVIVGHLGTSALAAFNVVMQLNSVSFMPAFGVTSSGAILVGESIGSGNKDAVPKLVWLTTKVTGLWMMSVGLAYALFPGLLLAGFQVPTEDARVFLEVAIEMLGYAVFWQLGDALNMTISEALRAAGDTRWTMVVRIVIAWFVFMPIASWLILSRGGGVTSAMLSLVGYVWAVAAVLVIRFRSGRWREIELVEAPLG